MSWYGKIIGGTLGSIFGPAGIVTGASLGHYFDNSGPQKGPLGDKKDAIPMSREQRQQILFHNTFSMFAKLAKANGAVTQVEVDTIQKFMIQHLNLNQESRRQATRIFNASKKDDVPFASLSKEFGLAFQHDLQMRAMLFEMLLAVALSDGSLHPEEDRLLQIALNDLLLDRQAYESIRRDCLPNLDPLYKVLNCSPTCTNDELKKAYRQASKKFHPDSLAASQVSDEIRQLAEAQFKDITEAYKKLCKFRKS
ncbi:MAG: TerB family tellurite resistance protein [Lentisphaeraceae bacterium]|nr:TerB family tellurite resistance protein [Lentisphaeraceae bacterium]